MFPAMGYPSPLTPLPHLEPFVLVKIKKKKFTTSYRKITLYSLEVVEKGAKPGALREIPPGKKYPPGPTLGYDSPLGSRSTRERNCVVIYLPYSFQGLANSGETYTIY